MRRRDFVRSVLAGCGAATAPCGLAEGLAGGEAQAVPQRRLTFDGGQWLTVAAVQDHLLPSEPDNPKAPGAREVQATSYLDLALAAPGFDAETRGFVLKGIGWLDDLSRTKGQAPFQDLDPGTREDLLHRIAETQAGERWLSTLIGLTLEALLADPIYGGNPGGIGWVWLEHDPGLPRPTELNRWERLAL